jgi:hypothetical protein
MDDVKLTAEGNTFFETLALEQTNELVIGIRVDTSMIAIEFEASNQILH